jgi:hypothetical protein
MVSLTHATGRSMHGVLPKFEGILLGWLRSYCNNSLETSSCIQASDVLKTRSEMTAVEGVVVHDLPTLHISEAVSRTDLLTCKAQ